MVWLCVACGVAEWLCVACGVAVCGMWYDCVVGCGCGYVGACGMVWHGVAV